MFVHLGVLIALIQFLRLWFVVGQRAFDIKAVFLLRSIMLLFRHIRRSHVLDLANPWVSYHSIFVLFCFHVVIPIIFRVVLKEKG